MFDRWWFPSAVSRHATAYDEQFIRTLIVAGVVFILVQCALVAFVWFFRSSRQSGGVTARPVNPRLELAWTAVTAVVFLGLLALGGRVWAGVQFTPASPNAEVIEVSAKQFAWNFRYPGADGQFGRTSTRYIDDASGNPFGLDDDDPASRDDIMAATLRVPANREVKLLLTARDVVHSFFVRELRIKQDVVPGMNIPFHFVANVPGTYEIPCSELCGLGHSQMRATMIVMPAAEYDRWKREQTR